MQASPTRGQARRLPALLALALLASCGTLDNGRGWGQDATLLPGWSRIGSAARKAALDPFTWVPLALAVGLSIDRMDHEIGDWAAENTPIFGSNRAADDFSDHARKALQQLSTVTPLLTDSGDEPGPWMAAKLRGLGVRAISTESRRLLTESTKVWVGRGRPDDSDRRSMPSGHTSAAFNYARWISEDLNQIGRAHV